MRTLISVVSTLAFAVLELSGLTQVGHAQTYPAKSITVVVPFPAGGPSDVVARIVTEHMSRTLRQQMVIENVGGAGGTLGSARVAAANPDGYTLLAGSMRGAVFSLLSPALKTQSSRIPTAERRGRSLLSSPFVTPRGHVLRTEQASWHHEPGRGYFSSREQAAYMAS